MVNLRVIVCMPSGITRVEERAVGEATLDQIQEIGETVKKALEKTPPELAADVVEKGIVLTGGGALPKSFDKLLGKEQGFLVGLLRTPH